MACLTVLEHSSHLGINNHLVDYIGRGCLLVVYCPTFFLELALQNLYKTGSKNPSFMKPLVTISQLLQSEPFFIPCPNSISYHHRCYHAHPLLLPLGQHPDRDCQVDHIGGYLTPIPSNKVAMYTDFSMTVGLVFVDQAGIIHLLTIETMSFDIAGNLISNSSTRPLSTMPASGRP